jgi:hypothetical protein
VLPDKFGLVQELSTIVSESQFTACRFSANHASNYLPLTADLPREKSRLVTALTEILSERDERVLKPEWLRGL